VTLARGIFEPNHCNGIWTYFLIQRGGRCQLWSQSDCWFCVDRGLLVQAKGLHLTAATLATVGKTERHEQVRRGPCCASERSSCWGLKSEVAYSSLGVPLHCAGSSLSPSFKPRISTAAARAQPEPTWGKDWGQMLSMKKKRTVHSFEELWLSVRFAIQLQLPRTVQVPQSLLTTSFMRVRPSDQRMLEGWQKLLASLIPF